jgi:GNAT superfamily N-acetyltransferase
MECEVRPAIEADIEKLPVIEQAASELFIGTPHSIAAELPCMSVEFLLEQHRDGRVWVATLNKKPVGYAVVTIHDRQPHLEEISVHPEHGKKGAGKRLVETACSWSASNGFQQITLSTFTDIPWNRPFYEKIGFKVLSESKLSGSLNALREKEASIGLDIVQRVMMVRRFS